VGTGKDVNMSIDTHEQQSASTTPEDKRDKFVRLAVKRVDKAITAISLIGNLANRNSYNYGEEDAARIVQALRAEIDGVEAQFNAATGRAGKPRFSL